MELTEISIKDLPLYSRDFDDDFPAEARALKDARASVDALLFTSFRHNGEDGLHLAWSEDGLKWTALNDDKSFLQRYSPRTKRQSGWPAGST